MLVILSNSNVRRISFSVLFTSYFWFCNDIISVLFTLHFPQDANHSQYSDCPGFRMLYEGYYMSDEEGQEELEEVQMELKKKEEEVNLA